MKYELKFQEIIQQKGIIKLVHVTRKNNLRLILNYFLTLTSISFIFLTFLPSIVAREI